MRSSSVVAPPALTVPQRRLLDDLLMVGVPRPVAEPDLAERLRALLTARTAETLRQWRDGRLSFSKSNITALEQCEGLVVARAADPSPRQMAVPTALGVVAHRAIQLASTIDGPVQQAVEHAIDSAASDPRFHDLYHGLSPWDQVEFTSKAVNHVLSFLDLFPPLEAAWNAQWERRLAVRLDGFDLVGVPDLILGRPRPDFSQTMFVADFKTGGLRPEHELEAMLYAFIATLRNGVPPFRSTVISLADGEWTPPDVTAPGLFDMAERVADAVNRHVELLLERRSPELHGGMWCRWCPNRTSCGSAETSDMAAGDRRYRVAAISEDAAAVPAGGHMSDGESNPFALDDAT